MAKKGDGLKKKKKKKKNRRLFKKVFLWETGLWLTLGNFMVKTQLLKGILYLTENWFSGNEMRSFIMIIFML